MKQMHRPSFLLAMVALFLLASPVSAIQSDAEEYEDITDEVALVRGLDQLDAIELMQMSRAELGDYMIETLAEDYPPEDAYADQRELVAVGLMDPDVDLYQLWLDLYTEQVAGFYNTETKEMVVVRSDDAGDGELTAMDQVTWAHEIVHALQDQHFNLSEGDFNREDVSDDRSLAISALIEGDASFTELEYLLQNQQLLQSLLDEVDQMDLDFAVLDSAPPIISATMGFPYDNGLSFVEAIHAEGGFDAVNAAFSDPPVSTEQILHPEKYLAGEMPVAIELPDFTTELDGEWSTFDVNTFGEYQIRVILEESSMSDQQALVASEGWGGDTYLVAGTDSEDAILWKSVWDTEEDASEFVRALALREAERWDASPTYRTNTHLAFETDDAMVEIILDGDTVTYAMGADPATVQTILGSEADMVVPGATPVG